MPETYLQYSTKPHEKPVGKEETPYYTSQGNPGKLHRKPANKRDIQQALRVVTTEKQQEEFTTQFLIDWLQRHGLDPDGEDEMNEYIRALGGLERIKSKMIATLKDRLHVT